MKLSDRVKSFEILGDRLRNYHEGSKDPELGQLVIAARQASDLNPWFTPEFVRFALNSLGEALRAEHLQRWLSVYEGKLTQPAVPEKVGVVMAGNIPAVGFHDFLSVLISGRRLLAKQSSADCFLLPAMADILTCIIPEWNNYIEFTGQKLENFDAIIATGSNNTSRYFEYYFSKYPHIIRQNRNSIGVLDGKESSDDLQGLAGDIMLYFGMGCRSVSKIYVPSGYDFSGLAVALEKYYSCVNHHKYRNNYDYRRSVFMVGRVPFIDTGVLLLTANRALSSGIAVLHYEYYSDPGEVAVQIREAMNGIQCVVSNMSMPFNTLKFGGSQKPSLWDYSDGVDTMKFLLSLA